MEVLARIKVVKWASINCCRVEGRGTIRDQSIGRCIIQMMTSNIFFIGRTMIVSNILYKLLVVNGIPKFLHTMKRIVCCIYAD